MKDAFRVWMEKYNIDLGEEFNFNSDTFKIDIDQEGKPILYISTCYGYQIATLASSGFSTITNALYKICMLEPPEPTSYVICPVCGCTLTIKHYDDGDYGAYCKRCSFSSTFKAKKIQDLINKIEDMEEMCIEHCRRYWTRYFRK